MFETVIGLEVHAQLNTNTKIFCSCATSFGEEVNTNVCPTCLALPGALPVLNKEAVKKSIGFAKAIGAKVNNPSRFDRKNYFYPDLPKAYQISQFSVPIVDMGSLVIDFEDGSHKTIGITRAHLEEDAGKNTHGNSESLVDLNRAGTPLLEIVSEPDMRNSTEVILYLKKLHSIIRYLDISDANMQEGSFRCDVNISIRPMGDSKLYTRCEIKNMNSFKFIEKAIAYEVARQIEAWEDGTYEQEVVQETRLYNTSTGQTKSMRGKEDSADYRYFPDPDLLPVVIPQDMMEECSKIPELPDEKKARFVSEFGIREYDAGVLTATKELADYFEAMMSEGIKKAKVAVTWLSVELAGRLSGGMNAHECGVEPKTLGLLVKRVEDGSISGKAAKEILDYVLENKNYDIDKIIDTLGLKQVSDDGAIEAIIDEVLTANPDKVEQYKAGKDKLFGFFVGQVMKASKGSANPAKVNELLKQKIQ